MTYQPAVTAHYVPRLSVNLSYPAVQAPTASFPTRSNSVAPNEKPTNIPAPKRYSASPVYSPLQSFNVLPKPIPTNATKTAAVNSQLVNQMKQQQLALQADNYQKVSNRNMSNQQEQIIEEEGLAQFEVMKKKYIRNQTVIGAIMGAIIMGVLIPLGIKRPMKRIYKILLGIGAGGLTGGLSTYLFTKKWMEPAK